MFIVLFSSEKLEKEVKKACEDETVLEMGQCAFHPVFIFALSLTCCHSF